MTTMNFRRAAILLLALTSALEGASAAQDQKSVFKACAESIGMRTDLDRKACEIHSRIIPIDAHIDVLLPSTGERYFLPNHGDRADLEKLRRGGMGAIALAIAVGYGPRTPEGFEAARAETQAKSSAIRSFAHKHSDDVELALSAADIERIHAQGKIAIIQSFLNARSIGKDLSAIRELHKTGVRLFGLVHDGNNDFADSSRYDDPRGPEHGGLSALGRQAIAEINKLGMIIDVSQMSTAALLQTVAISRAPVIASHSSVRALADNVRNLSDEELNAIKRNGGVVHVTAFNAYLVEPPKDFEERVRSLRIGYGLAPTYNSVLGFTDGLETLTNQQQSDFFDRVSEIYRPANVKDLVDHIEYIANHIGIDFVGIGSDFNHGAGIQDFNSAADAPNVTRELVRRGFTEQEVAKIWGGNFLRVFKAAEPAKDERPRSSR